MNKIKVMTILGTRPEIIRLSSVIKVLDKYTDHILVHTGQNYDYELNEVFFKDLAIPNPDHVLDVNTNSLGSVLGDTLIKIEKILINEKPDAVLVLGDTNSSIALLMAKRMKIPTYHMEAGNRSFDNNVPEEINRKLADHIADFNLVYTEHARRHLLAEGLPHRNIYLTGSPMFEVLSSNQHLFDKSNILEKLKIKKRNYFVVSVHREENVDNPMSLKNILSCLNKLYDTYELPIIVSTHPRTKNRLKKLQINDSKNKIKFMKPFGFNDYIKLQKESICSISDSGTISEESSILNFPAVTIRQSMERPEAIDAGSIILTGFDPDVFLSSINFSIKNHNVENNNTVPEEYEIPNTSSRVLKLILGTSRLVNKWKNLDDFNRYDW